jgi:hypothetical protein
MQSKRENKQREKRQAKYIPLFLIKINEVKKIA